MRKSSPDSISILSSIQKNGDVYKETACRSFIVTGVILNSSNINLLMIYVKVKVFNIKINLIQISIIQ